MYVVDIVLPSPYRPETKRRGGPPHTHDTRTRMNAGALGPSPPGAKAFVSRVVAPQAVAVDGQQHVLWSDARRSRSAPRVRELRGSQRGAAPGRQGRTTAVLCIDKQNNCCMERRDRHAARKCSTDGICGKNLFGHRQILVGFYSRVPKFKAMYVFVKIDAVVGWQKQNNGSACQTFRSQS